MGAMCSCREARAKPKNTTRRRRRKEEKTGGRRRSRSRSRSRSRPRSRSRSKARKGTREATRTSSGRTRRTRKPRRRDVNSGAVGSDSEPGAMIEGQDPGERSVDTSAPSTQQKSPSSDSAGVASVQLQASSPPKKTPAEKTPPKKASWMENVDIRRVLTSWFGREIIEDRDSMASSEYRSRRRETMKQFMEGKGLGGFVSLVQKAGEGGFESDPVWSSPHGLLAQVVLLDQVSRIIYGEKEHLKYDGIAYKIVAGGVRGGCLRDFNGTEFMFFMLPLIHSEEMDHHEIFRAEMTRRHDKFTDEYKTLKGLLQSSDIRFTKRDGKRVPAPEWASKYDLLVKQARGCKRSFKNIKRLLDINDMYESVLKRFGRLPTLNKYLGRATTQDEAQWLVSDENTISGPRAGLKVPKSVADDRSVASEESLQLGISASDISMAERRMSQ